MATGILLLGTGLAGIATPGGWPVGGLLWPSLRMEPGSSPPLKTGLFQSKGRNG